MVYNIKQYRVKDDCQFNLIPMSAESIQGAIALLIRTELSLHGCSYRYNNHTLDTSAYLSGCHDTTSFEVISDADKVFMNNFLSAFETAFGTTQQEQVEIATNPANIYQALEGVREDYSKYKCLVFALCIASGLSHLQADMVVENHKNIFQIAIGLTMVADGDDFELVFG